VIWSAAAVGLAGGATVQSPTPTTYMEDSRPGVGFPSGAGAIVVEGLGVLGSCAGSYYSESQVKSATVNHLNQNQQTVTEITPQAYCGSISAYEGLVSRIKSYVETYASNPGRYWAGFMLDEEPGYQFSASSLETLNNDTENVMVNTPGLSWYFQEDQPNGWVLSTYNNILGYSWPAPQIYSSSMASATNSECSTYGNCTNLVTMDTQMAYPWDDRDYVTGLVHQTPWSIGSWSYTNWFNKWRAQ
jgi:hypothetical protein